MGKASAAALLLAAPLVAANVEERAWCVVESPHFELVTDVREDAALALANAVDRFRVAASALLPGLPDPDSGRRPALRLLVFKRARDFAGLFEFPRIAGFTQPSLRRSLLVFGPSASGHLDTNAFHEYTHYLLRSRVTVNLPIWYEEGFASYLSTLEVDADGVVTVGRGPFALLRHLLATPGTEFEGMFEERYRMDWQRHDLRDIYTLAWGVVRFLHHARQPGGKPYAETIGGLLAAIDQGAPSAAALRETVGVAPAALRERMRQHYDRFRFTPPPVFKFRLPGHAPPVFRYDCLDATGKLLVLADALARHRPERASAFYEQVLERAPGHVPALVGLSRLQQDADEALATAEAAAAAAPTNAGALARAAQARLARCPRPAGAVCEQLWREAAQGYARALALDPTLADAALGLGILYLHSGRAEQAAPHLRTALARAPWSPVVHFYLGTAYRLAGAVAEARRHLRKTAHWHPDLRWRQRASQALDALAGGDGPRQRPSTTADNVAPPPK